jgi:hypothetical protein
MSNGSGLDGLCVGVFVIVGVKEVVGVKVGVGVGV